MWDWIRSFFNKKERVKIIELQAAFDTLMFDYNFHKSRLDDAIKIANGKRIVKCDHKKCIDWEDGTCALPEVKLTLGSKGIVRCAEVTESIEAEMKEEAAVKFVINSVD